MNRPTALLLLGSLLAVAGCGADSESETVAGVAEPVAESHLDPDDPSVLRRPFSAEQIRDAMPVGLVVDLRTATLEGESVQRWTVVAADEDGVEIEYANFDPDGNIAGEPVVNRSTWNELRDHATFPAERGTREAETRDTDLGMLDGWLYTVTDGADGSVTEYFFARSLPGAPVSVKTTRGEELVMEMNQIARGD